jgi:hypothetical protein
MIAVLQVLAGAWLGFGVGTMAALEAIRRGWWR